LKREIIRRLSLQEGSLEINEPAILFLRLSYVGSKYGSNMDPMEISRPQIENKRRKNTLEFFFAEDRLSLASLAP